MRKKILYCLLLLVVIVSSCQNLEKVSKPDTLIARDKMIRILTDIAFIRAAKSSYKKVFDIEKIDPEAYVLKKHNIDSAVFAENNRWYTSQTDRYEDIFNKVKINLKENKTKFDRLRKEEDSIKKIKDSIKKAKEAIKDGKVILDDIDDEELESFEEDIEEAINSKKNKPTPAAAEKKKQLPQ